MEEIKKIALQVAKDNGYINAEYWGEYKGYKIFDLIPDETQEFSCCGFPILLKINQEKEEVETSKGSEYFEIRDFFENKNKQSKKKQPLEEIKQKAKAKYKDLKKR